MKRILVFAYGTVVYVAFLGVFLYLIGFLGDFLVPKSLNDGTASAPMPAVLINIGLISLFGVQHTIMARPPFKRFLARFIPEAAERSTFVLTTVGILALMFWQWRPVEGTLWSIENEALRGAVWAVFALGWGIVLISTFLINHFDLFGLRQVSLYAMKKDYTHVPVKVSSLYRLVRNPLMTGFIIAFWAIPDMTLSHFVFSATYTVYILIGIQFEERTLASQLGKVYTDYRAATPMLIPNPARGLTPAIQSAPVPQASGQSAVS